MIPYNDFYNSNLDNFRFSFYVLYDYSAISKYCCNLLLFCVGSSNRDLYTNIYSLRLLFSYTSYLLVDYNFYRFYFSNLFYDYDFIILIWCCLINNYWCYNVFLIYISYLSFYCTFLPNYILNLSIVFLYDDYTTC